MPLVSTASRAGARVGADACPGVLDLHAAADGPLARLRVPGGLLGADALRSLGALSLAHADGSVELTSRANVQLRGVRDADALAAGLSEAGLLPSGAHDRSRNLALSPLTGLGVAGSGDVDGRPMLRALDAALLADAGLAELPGRFILAVDDGTGLPATADVTLRWRGGDWQLLVDGYVCGAGDVAAALAAAREFLRVRRGDATVWRIRDLPGGAAALGVPSGERVAPAPERLTVGLRGDRILVAAAWLQRLDPAQLAALEAGLAPGAELRLAPAGRIVVPLRTPGEVATLAAAGLVVDGTDQRGQVTACSGLGACARATVDVRTLAADLVAGGRAGGPRHLVACKRRCGLPADAEAVACE